MSLETNIISIGTSKGIRLPKWLLEKYHFSKSVKIIEKDQSLLLEPVDNQKVRAGWKAAFEKIPKTKQDMLIEMPASEWDKTGWEW